LVDDVDDAQLASATVTIVANYFMNEDTLIFTNQLGITGSFNDGAGILTLTGPANLADFQTAIRNVNYENTSSTPDPATRTVRFIVSDPALLASDPFDRDITIATANDLPTITGTMTDLDYTEGSGPVAIDSGILVNDTDDVNLAGGTISISTNYTQGEDLLAFTDQLGIVGNFDANTGILTLTGSTTLADYQTAIRSITYENTSPAPNLATRTVSFVVNDGTDSSLPFTRNINIISIVEAPTVTGTGGVLDYTEGDGAVIIDSGFGVADPDDINLESGSVVVSNNYVQGQDILGFTDQSGITGSFDQATGALTLTGTSSIANYLAAISTVTYENPSDNPNTSLRTVSFTVNDGEGNSNSVTRNINVIPVNDPPNAEDDNYSGLEDETIAGNVLDNDSDPDGDSIIINTSPLTLTVNGNLVLNNDGTFTYTPDEDFSGQDSFRYEICDDGNPTECDDAMVTITLDEVIDPVVVYQAVSPNGDSFNDLWIIDGIEQFPSNIVRLFDRWNSLVFEAAGYDNTNVVWDGESNKGLTTGELPEGTYFYTVNLGDGSQVIKGFLVLER